MIYQASLLGFLESPFLTQWAQFPDKDTPVRSHSGTIGMVGGSFLAYVISRIG